MRPCCPAVLLRAAAGGMPRPAPSLSQGSGGKLLRWLDTSGLALYFLDRMTQLALCDMLPPEMLSRLRQNLSDNTVRTYGMMAEQTDIQRGFQSAAISYAVLKGFSLWPSSLPRPELRLPARSGFSGRREERACGAASPRDARLSPARDQWKKLGVQVERDSRHFAEGSIQERALPLGRAAPRDQRPGPKFGAGTHRKASFVRHRHACSVSRRPPSGTRSAPLQTYFQRVFARLTPD